MNDDVVVVVISADVVRLGVDGGGALYLGVLPLGNDIRMLLQTNRSLLQTACHGGVGAQIRKNKVLSMVLWSNSSSEQLNFIERLESVKGSTMPMSEIVCFPVLNFNYSHVENSLFFALDWAVSL